MTLQYAPDHWANDPIPESSLSKAQELGKLPVNRVEWDFLRNIIPQDLTGRRVLDYGCGTGYIGILCAQRGAEVTGIDQSECAVLAATHAAKVQGVGGKCTFIVGREVSGGHYDLIISKDVIEHISDDDGWVKSVSNALVPGGLFICATQNSWCLTFALEGSYHRVWRGNKSWMGWDPTHVRFYNPLSLGKLLRRHGLRVSKWASFWIIPYNILTWLTLLKVDITLPWLSYFDYWFGHSFPFNRFGFGLIVVATKNERPTAAQ